jgi:hypothetical protein
MATVILITPSPLSTREGGEASLKIIINGYFKVHSLANFMFHETTFFHVNQQN